MSCKNLLGIMLTEKHITIREATTKEDSLIAKHSYQMWLDIGVDESNIILEWQNITLQFIEEARRDLLMMKKYSGEKENARIIHTPMNFFIKRVNFGRTGLPPLCSSLISIGI
ncbi:hypothetical protein [Nostoc sp. 'Lobaria pulmonaria (5183) cyanobiont']|uniref:hypothetical protein n=1 Tax=Nostoc sp. 'Lobaria pulmonaria (5183) cyanobiont' TaxID=1618022 RepID=UPI00131A306C|nr:hypothetical protein [Nostoc sp. 'Lobaria pulmonaria (5183) cyanobiont']